MDKIKVFMKENLGGETVDEIVLVESSDLNCADLGEYESIHTKLSRWFIKYFSAACNVRITYLENSGTSNEKTVDKKDDDCDRDIQKDNSRLNRNMNIIKKVVLVVYIYTAIRFVFFLYFQYKYDFSSMKLKRFDIDLLSLSSESVQIKWKEKTRFDTDFLLTVNQSEFKQSLELERQHSWEVLKSLGCPYVHQSFIAETGYLTVLGLTALTYPIPFMSMTDVDTFFFGMMLDKPAELTKCRKRIQHHATVILNSSKNFVLAHATLCALGSRDKLATLKQLKSKSRMRKQARDHHETVRIVEHWLKSDTLVPVNYSAEWIHEMSKIFSTVNTVQVSFSLVQDAFLLWFVHLLLGNQLELDPIDVWSIFELALHAFIDVVATSFYIGLFDALSRNQIRYIRWLRKQMMEHITTLKEINEKLYQLTDELQVEPKSNCDTFCARNVIDKRLLQQMNERFLLALFQYRIFVTEFGYLRKVFKVSANIILMIVFFVPIVVRLHVSYVDESLQPYAIIFCFSVIFFSDTVLVAWCRMHQMGVELARFIWSLQAESTKLNTALLSHNLEPAYYEHSVQLYNKETEDPTKLYRQLAIMTIVGPITYPNLVQVHYWFFLLMISAFFEVESWLKLLGPRFHDPLGVFATPQLP